MQISRLVAATAAAAMLVAPAMAQMDYHGFKPETVDALNARLETPLSSEALAALSQNRDIEVCGGTNAVSTMPPEAWEARVANANPPGGDVVMPVPKTALSPEYPALLNVLGVEGVCEVMFDVTAAGETENVLTSCSLPAFAEATSAVVEPLQFDAAEGADSPATENILLPFNYCLEDDAE